MIRRLRESVFQSFKPVQEAGSAKYPANHKPGMRVPKGGSSCASCEYLGKDKRTCTNKFFIRWNGSNLIPAPIDEYCSDWYEPNG
jgi:hypothetical protein